MNPYFVPDLKMSRALERAAARAVDVKIIIPNKSDLKHFPLINSIYCRKLVRKKVKVYEYCPNVLHAKILLIDETVIMGSSNLNSRTQKHDWEIDITLDKPEIIQIIRSRILQDLQNSKQVSYQSILQKFRPQRRIIPIFRTISYFL